jgi:hypothetical protein
LTQETNIHAHEQIQDFLIPKLEGPGYHVMIPGSLVPDFTTSSSMGARVGDRTGETARSSMIGVDLSSSLANRAVVSAAFAGAAAGAGAVAVVALDGAVSVARGALHYYCGYHGEAQELALSGPIWCGRQRAEAMDDIPASQEDMAGGR